MKNVLKSLALASTVMFAFACKSDPSASSNTATTPAATEQPQALAASASAAAATAAPAAAAVAQAATVAVTPDNKQVSPAPTATPAAQGGGKTTAVKFDEMSYDWGKIKEGEKMTHVFKFKNTGNNDLIISDARGSCGCTVPEWPKEPIKAGKTGEIKVVFDSEHKSGPQSKTVTITANTEPSNVVLMIKGTVDPKEEGKAN